MTGAMTTGHPFGMSETSPTPTATGASKMTQQTQCPVYHVRRRLTGHRNDAANMSKPAVHDNNHLKEETYP